MGVQTRLAAPLWRCMKPLQPIHYERRARTIGIRCYGCFYILEKHQPTLTTSPILNTSRSPNEASASSSPSIVPSSFYSKGGKRKNRRKVLINARKPKTRKLQMGPAPPPKCNSQLEDERSIASLQIIVGLDLCSGATPLV